jgi:hypothetical protein
MSERQLIMPTARTIIHSDDELQMGSQYLRYHVRMYVESLLWLNQHASATTWDTVRNAVLEDFLVHTRVLAKFLMGDGASARDDDVIALDYFHDKSGAYQPLASALVKAQAAEIGGHLVHITKKPMPKLKSQQEWQIDDPVKELVPALNAFFNSVPDARVVPGLKKECLDLLSRPDKRPPQVSLYAST